MAGGNPENGGRVTIRELYGVLQEQNEARTEMEHRIIGKLDDVCDSVSRHDERIKRNTDEIEKLRTRSNVNDIAVGVAAAVTSAISAFFGIKH